MRRSRTDSAPNRTSGSMAPPTSTLSAIWYSNFFGAEPYTLLPYDQVNPAYVSLFTTLTTLYTVITRPPIEVPFGYGLARAQRTVGAGRRRGVVVKRTLGPVSTGMGDRLPVGIPSRYVTSQLGQLSLASLQSR